MTWLSTLRQRFASRANTPLDAAEFVVVDTETSGLNPHRDRLLSIGAVRVRRSKLLIADTFSATLRQSSPSSDANILVHGISGTQQTEGEAPSEALQRFVAYAGASPLIAFHAEFDRLVLQRALKLECSAALPGEWLDLAVLLPLLFSAQRHFTALDEWLAHFDIEPSVRHDALGDAAATAQLLLVALDAARQQRVSDLHGLATLAASARWLPSAGTASSA